MAASFAFCNDCDLMTRRAFEEVHGVLDRLGIPGGDSFWLFDPSGGDMALFTHDTRHHGPQHAWLLDQIDAGVLDILHSAGSFGERFNRGYSPTRDEIARALDYLASVARVPAVWTNHGDVHNTQNIGGGSPADHHRGDLPGSTSYCLDLLVERGIRYFWLDRLLVRDPAAVYRVTAPERCRDGREIVTFTRYLSPEIEWSPNAQNLDRQLGRAEIDQVSANQQDTVLYLHWGCHHQGRVAVTPGDPTLTSENRAALENFAAGVAERGDQIVRLVPLLDASAARPVDEEVQRIGAAVVRSERDRPDQFYFNQYWKHGVDYFKGRVTSLAVSGSRALDAGCGVGQWCYALQPHFERVYGVEIGHAPVVHLARLSQALRWPDGPQFARASIEQLPFADGSFDLVFCYGVLFVTHIRTSLLEFTRVLSPDGTIYLCLNGDGWYEYLCDERFKDRSENDVLPFAEPLFNALVARVGGEAAFDAVCRDSFAARPAAFWTDVERVRRTFAETFTSPVVDLPALVSRYSDRVTRLIARLVQARLEPRVPAMGGRGSLFRRMAARFRGSASTAVSPALNDCFPSAGIGSTNRPFMPDEFAHLSKLTGLRVVEHGPDAALSPGARPIYEGVFNGHDSVWECVLRRGSVDVRSAS